MFPDLSKYQIRWDRYRKWKIEKDFMTEIMWFMRMEWYLCFHPADVWLSDKFLDLFFCDAQWIWRNIEFKQIEWKTYNLKKFEDEQVIYLRELEKRNPEIARVFIYSQKTKTYKVFRFSELISMSDSRWSCKIF